MIDGFVADKATLDKEVLKLTDWYTDDLFHSAFDDMIIADFSRIFCDPERFTDDTQEIMAQYGMGVLYEKSDEGEIIRNITPDLRERILNEYYWKHHNRLNQAVSKQLKLYGKVLIIDCHSFKNSPLKRNLNQEINRPDFNIGTDSFHTPQKLIDISVDFFNKLGYSLGIDWPYSGSIVPIEHYKKTKSVNSIMLEVNKKLYLNQFTNEKSNNYFEIKRIIQQFINTMRKAHSSL